MALPFKRILFGASVSRKLISATIVFSTVIALLATLGQLYFDYTQSIKTIEGSIESIEITHLKSLSEGVWVFNDRQVQTQLEGINSLPDIEYLSIEIDGAKRWSIGEAQSKRTINRALPLTHELDGKSVPLGVLNISASVDNVLSRLFEKFVVILISNTVKTFFVAGFMFLIFWYFIARPLEDIAIYLGHQGPIKDNKEFKYSTGRDNAHQDEFGIIATELNKLRQQLFDTIQELEISKAELELNVNERTKQLKQEVEERKRTEVHLVEAIEAAEQASRAKSAFLTNMSHELRTPLNAVIGFSQAMKSGISGPLETKQREYLEIIESSGSHLLDLINDILDVSSIEAGKVDFHDSEVEIHRTVDEIIKMILPRAELNEVSVKNDIDLPDLRISVDEHRFKQIMTNLITNAVKYNRPGGEVVVSAGRVNGGLSIIVNDNGIGMKEKDVGAALEKFTRIDTNSDENIEGTGLGLPLANGLVEALGGTLTIDSRFGVGTSVIVQLPTTRIVV